MPLSGTLDLGSVGANTPSGAWFLLGLDGKHYAITGHGGPDPLGSAKLGAAETLTPLPTINETQWRLDLISLGFAGHTGGVYYCWPTNPIPAPGTAYFWILGRSDVLARQTAGVRYTIDATGTVVVDGGFLLKYSVAGGADAYPSTCRGAQVIGGVLYAVCRLGANSSQHGWYLVRLPLSGTLEDLTDGSWNTYVTKFVSYPFPGNSYFDTSSGRYYQNRCSIFQDDPTSGNIGVLSYLGISEVPGSQSLITTTGSEYWVIAPLSRTVVTSMRDDRALFGQPWADSGTLYTGAASALARNDYTAPTVNAVAGGDEIIFGRSFSDQPTKMRFRRYFRSATTFLISHLDTFEVTILGPGVAMESVFAARDTASGSLLYTATDTRNWHFGEAVVSPPATPALCPHADDWADPQGPCDVDWPKCELVPGNITVEAVSPSVSPGHAFSAFEQVLKPDAGCWRITLADIPIWTKANLLTWREIESALGGRVGTICVPFYEALYSATPIAATVTGSWGIGVTRITVTQTAGTTLAAGMHFSIGERGYRVKSASVSGGLTTIKIWPPVRDAIITGAVCDFNDPAVRCRLERDDGMDLNLELLRFGKATVAFVEDV